MNEIQSKQKQRQCTDLHIFYAIRELFSITISHLNSIPQPLKNTILERIINTELDILNICRAQRKRDDNLAKISNYEVVKDSLDEIRMYIDILWNLEKKVIKEYKKDDFYKHIGKIENLIDDNIELYLS